MACRFVRCTLACVVMAAWASVASAQTWTPEQKEIWTLEEQQWQMSKERDISWVDKMVHPNLSVWETGQRGPQNRASVERWSRFGYSGTTTLEQELFPISITITGNVAVVQYNYQVVREDYKKERQTVQGHYTDVLVRDGGRWMYIAWSGGDDPQR